MISFSPASFTSLQHVTFQKLHVSRHRSPALLPLAPHEPTAPVVQWRPSQSAQHAEASAQLCDACSSDSAPQDTPQLHELCCNACKEQGVRTGVLIEDSTDALPDSQNAAQMQGVQVCMKRHCNELSSKRNNARRCGPLARSECIDMQCITVCSALCCANMRLPRCPMQDQASRNMTGPSHREQEQSAAHLACA